MSIKSIRTGYKGISALAGNPVLGDFESIDSASPSGSTNTVTFTNIPQTFQHLQVRLIARDNYTSTVNGINIRVGNGSVDSGSNYSWYRFRGDGSGTTLDSGTSQTAGNMVITSANDTSSSYAVAVIDFLDYRDTNKYKTWRMLNGYNRNGSGDMWFISGLWMSKSAIDTISFVIGGSGINFNSNSRFALYGIRG